MRKIAYSRDRLAEAREIRLAWRNGEAAERIPFVYTVPYKQEKYSRHELHTTPKYAVETMLEEMENQFAVFPDSDYVPMFNMGYLGQQVLGSMFGLREMVVGHAKPFAVGVVVESLEKELDTLPQRFDLNSGLGPLLREAIQIAVEETGGEIPIRVHDYQSPLGTASKLMGFENLMYAMYDEPELFHKFMKLCVKAIADSIRAAEEWAGSPELIIKSTVDPFEGGGMVIWDDYISVMTPELHKEFCAPYNVELFEIFGKGHLHTCGPYFPGYIDAVIASKPTSIDIVFLNGKTRTYEDMLTLKEISLREGIRLNGRARFGDKPASPELAATLAEGGGFMWQDAGSAEAGLRYLNIARQTKAQKMQKVI